MGQPRYKPGVVLCTLNVADKFKLFLANTFDPVTFVGVAFNAGIGQAQDSDPSYGQGVAGFGNRFGAYFLDQAQSQFFKSFAYPVIFSEAPRYYRLGQGRRAGACGTRSNIPSWRTAKTARACSIFPSGWEPPAPQC